MIKKILLIIIFLFIHNTPIQAQTYTRITTHSNWDYLPSWSNDGSKIGFTSKRSGYDWIYIYSLNDGSINKMNIEGRHYTCQHTAWSPDDSKIAFRVGTAYPTTFDLYVIPSTGGLPDRLTYMYGFPGCLSWSPDGNHILFAFRKSLFTQNEDVYLVPSTVGSTVKIVSSDDFPGYSSACLSPNGERIAFNSSDPCWLNYNIYIMELSSGNIRQLTFGNKDHRPAWSPDGKWIAFSRELGRDNKYS